MYVYTLKNDDLILRNDECIMKRSPLDNFMAATIVSPAPGELYYSDLSIARHVYHS